MSTSSGRFRHISALFGYCAASLVFVWPLPLHLSTHLLGPVDGDTGVYVWNQWVFRHELLDNGALPYFTNQIFSLTRPANLALHNYTPFQNLLALPLMGVFGVVATFNVVTLLMSVLTAYMTFLLALRATGRYAEAWIAGLFFAWSPVLVTRGIAHLSVAAAAPLAAYLLVLVHAGDHPRPKDAILLGLAACWAAAVDVYFAVYCALISVALAMVRSVRISVRPTTPRTRAVAWILNVSLFTAGVTVIAILASGGWTLTAVSQVVGMHSLYTPVLLLTVFALARVAWRYRLVTSGDLPDRWLRGVVRLNGAALLVAAVLLSPWLYGAALRLRDAGWDGPALFWRSSPAGVDVLALVLPNPNHPWAPDTVRGWLSPRPDAYFENVASLPFVVIAVLVAAWRIGWKAPRLWTGLAIVFGLLALGPFVHLAGFNTYVPGPWALLRYVPVVGLARTPARFTVVLMLALAILFASALAHLSHRYRGRRRVLVPLLASALAFELLPAPRPLFSAAIPRVYTEVKRDPGEGRVLELPFGIRDGTFSAGNFSARSQFFQTYHHKRLIGGYLSRVSQRRVAETRRVDMLDALIVLSEGGHLDPAREAQLIADGPSFVERAHVQFVVIDTTRSSKALQVFARRAFGLVADGTDGAFELYRTGF